MFVFSSVSWAGLHWCLVTQDIQRQRKMERDRQTERGRRDGERKKETQREGQRDKQTDRDIRIKPIVNFCCEKLGPILH